MSVRERWARARTSSDFAWACLAANLLGVPGLGTLMAGRPEAAPQLVLAIVGGVLLTWWLGRAVLAYLRALSAGPLVIPDLRLAAWGGGLFAVSWIWPLASSASVLRATRRARDAERPS